MLKKILVISGGISKEREISLVTGREVYKALKKAGYKVINCEPDGDLIKNIRNFNVIHSLIFGFSTVVIYLSLFDYRKHGE